MNRIQTVIGCAAGRPWSEKVIAGVVWRVAIAIAFVVVGAFASRTALAQSPYHERHDVFGARTPSHVVMPQVRGFRLDRSHADIRVDVVRASVRIVDQTAATTLDIRIENPSNQQAEAVLLLPVPDDAVVSAFEFEGIASEPTAEVLLRDEARRIYDSIVAQIRDPALLEFAGYNLIRSSVFPVEAGGSQRIRLTYESILPIGEGGRVDYVLPRSESLAVSVPWDIKVELRSSRPISTVYSPSHRLEVTHDEPRRATLSLYDAAYGATPGPFRLSYLSESPNGPAATLFAYPDPKVGGGYFLLLAGLPVSLPDEASRPKREVTLVIDRSGSMAGEKLNQTIAAAKQIIHGLGDGEYFNIIDYATTVEMFAHRPVAATDRTQNESDAYLQSIRPRGGTNIHDALVAALRQPVHDGTIPIVLFLTDGLPTIGQTSERAIREAVKVGNGYERRIFTIGVGSDVNVPLLDRVAETTRGTSEYILPGEDVEVKVTEVFERLYGPVFADLEIDILNDTGNRDVMIARELMPVILPDLYDGDQLLLTGQYTRDEPIEFVVKGNYLGTTRQFAFKFNLDKASVDNAFAARLWADRRISYLIDQVRLVGDAASSPMHITAAFDPWNDPKLRELIEEIMRLSTEFGILSEYTSFLAREGTVLENWNELVAVCGSNLDRRAMQTRSGLGAVNQGLNLKSGKMRAQLNYSNSFLDAELNTVQTATIQQICDRAFFKNGTQWVDSNLIHQNEGSTATVSIDETIDYGSEQHLELLQRLISEKRQGLLALDGDILIEVDSRNVLVRNRD